VIYYACAAKLSQKQASSFITFLIPCACTMEQRAGEHIAEAVSLAGRDRQVAWSAALWDKCVKELVRLSADGSKERLGTLCGSQ